MRILLILGLLSTLACLGVAQENPKPIIEPSKSETARSRIEPLKVGDIAPDFTLTDDAGKSVKLSADKRNTLLVFYRGYW